MRKKSIIVLLILTAMGVSNGLYAANTFGVSFIGYYDYADLSAGNYNAFLPGIRGEFYLNDYIGFSADAVIKKAANYDDVYYATYIADIVLRLPLGLMEPYVATGPAYQGVIVGTDPAIDDHAFAYDVRGGIDFNVKDSFSIGAEVNFLVDDVRTFVEGFSALTSVQQKQLIQQYGTIGITAKLKF